MTGLVLQRDLLQAIWWLVGQCRNDSADLFRREVWNLEMTGDMQCCNRQGSCNSLGYRNSTPERRISLTIAQEGLRQNVPPTTAATRNVKKKYTPLLDRECPPNTDFERIRNKSRDSKLFQDIPKHFEIFKKIELPGPRKIS